MKLLDVIDQLTQIYAEHGDIEVLHYVPNCCYGDYEDDVESVEVDQNEGFPYVLVG